MRRCKGDSPFDDPIQYEKMLNLRMNGLGPTELGKMFGVDHTTIIYHARKNNISTPIIRAITISGSCNNNQRVSISLMSIQMVRYDEDGSRINSGKDYAEYVAEAEKREWERLLKGNKKKND